MEGHFPPESGLGFLEEEVPARSLRAAGMALLVADVDPDTKQTLGR